MRNETVAIDLGSGNVHLRLRIAHRWVCDTAYGRDPPLAADSVWRDIDILGLAHRH